MRHIIEGSTISIIMCKVWLDGVSCNRVSEASHGEGRGGREGERGRERGGREGDREGGEGGREGWE